MNIIKNALEYYDRKIHENKKKNKMYKNGDLRDNIFIVNNITYKAEIIAMYNTKFNVWIWSWAYYEFNKENTIISRSLLNYGLNIENTDLNQNTNIFLKNFFTTSRILITDRLQLEIFIAICQYISKVDYIHSYTNKHYSLIQYVVIKN